MRINRFIAASSGWSRRGADAAIAARRVLVNGQTPQAGQNVTEHDTVTLDGHPLGLAATKTVIFNKPAGYVTSRNGQGSKTIYDLLPAELHNLNPVGRLDKDSSGLLLLTNDGQLAQQLTHPSFRKRKCYEVTLDKPLTPPAREQITGPGVALEDGSSKFDLNRLEKNDDYKWLAILYEGRNRQIRRTFAALGYTVVRLHRNRFGDYRLGELKPGAWQALL